MSEQTARSMAASKRWMTQQQTAEYLAFSVRQLQILTKQGRLPASYALGPRSPRYEQQAIDAAMMQNVEGLENVK